MKRPAVLVLLLTFVGLVAATLWVPCHPIHWRSWTTAPDPIYWAWTGNVWWSEPGATFYRGVGVAVIPSDSLHKIWFLDRWWLATEYALILAVGGLLALALHLRERRRVSETGA